ncbi:hypothetical protein JTB14_025717 [Gonioctena quinquepunctata]|nr:hypothetical protein JTB14_025717 [Gonioctena quinquepunctata]
MDFLRSIIVDEDDDLDDLNVIIHGIPRRVYNRADYYNSFDDLTFFKRFRVTKPTAILILNEIEVEIEHPYNLKPPILYWGLRRCPFVNRFTHNVGRALAGLNRRFIRMPETAEEINKTQLEFYEKARFPRVIGAVDGTDIKIQSPEVVVATAALHNICKENNEEDPPDPEDLELFLRIMEEDEVPHIPPHVQENDAAIAFQTQRVFY